MKEKLYLISFPDHILLLKEVRTTNQELEEETKEGLLAELQAHSCWHILWLMNN